MNRIFEALCPQCSGTLLKVRNPANSSLNDDQFDSVKAGDWYCTTCKPTKEKYQHAYFWDREVKHALPEGMYVGVKLSTVAGICVAQVTAEDTEELDTEVVRYANGVTSKVQHADLLIPPEKPPKEITDMLDWLYSKYEQEMARSNNLLTKLKSIAEKDTTEEHYGRYKDGYSTRGLANELDNVIFIARDTLGLPQEKEISADEVE